MPAPSAAAQAAFPWNIAAPSFVIPAHIPENAAFLTGKVREVGLCFFESASCLAYGPEILPAALAELPLRWHVHLPLDLLWEDGGTHAADTASRLLEKIQHLSPCRAVLHPPYLTSDTSGTTERSSLKAHAGHCMSARLQGQKNADDNGVEERQEASRHARQQEVLARFARLWRRRWDVPLLLENTEYCDLTTLQPVLETENCGVCLDVGHYLGYGQTALAHTPALLARVGMVHWSAPGTGDQHRPLTALSQAQRNAARALAQSLPPHTRHMLEIFSWQGITDSMPVLEDCLKAL